MKVNVCLFGCDDSTSFNINITSELQLQLLDELARLSKEISTYGCMPTLGYKILEDKNV